MNMVLHRIKRNRARFCLKLFHNLEEFKNTLKSKYRKRVTVVKKYAEKLGLPKDYLKKEIYECEVMVISELEKDNV